jgi:hypothetical protein
VASSIDSNIGIGGYPVEEGLDGFALPYDGYYGFAISNETGGESVDMEFITRFDDTPLDFNVQQGSLTPPCDAAGAIAVAALDVATYGLEPYSSQGPTNGPGGSLSGGSVKPDLASFANVSTASYGPRATSGGFSGTSAACPHVAGAAALVWSGYPEYSASQVRSHLESNAVDMGDAGKDNAYGYGRSLLGEPPGGGCTDPDTPSGISASHTTVSSGVPYTISWNAAATADSYELQEALNLTFLNPTTISVAGTSYTLQHTVGSTTNYYYRVRALRDCGSSSGWSSSVRVIVTPGTGGTYQYMVAGIAAWPGDEGTFWKSYLSVANLGSSTANLQFTYRYDGGTAYASHTLGAGDTIGWDDVVTYLFAVGGTTAGAVEVTSDQPVIVQARTYNDTPDGTYGQFLPGASEGDFLEYGAQGFLGQLRKTLSFRTNIGFVNPGSSDCEVRITVYSASGSQLGQPITTSVPAGGWAQVNRALEQVGVGTADPAYAIVEVTTAGCGVWAYASVVDNDSGDPTTIPVVLLN